MWLLEIKGATKEEFYNTCFMSVECKSIANKVKHLECLYYLKKYAISDIKDLQKAIPNIVYQLTKI